MHCKFNCFALNFHGTQHGIYVTGFPYESILCKNEQPVCIMNILAFWLTSLTTQAYIKLINCSSKNPKPCEKRHCLKRDRKVSKVVAKNTTKVCFSFFNLYSMTKQNISKKSVFVCLLDLDSAWSSTWYQMPFSFFMMQSATVDIDFCWLLSIVHRFIYRQSLIFLSIPKSTF